MQCIAENTERLHLQQQTLNLEQKQQKRLLDISLQKKKEAEEAQRLSLFEANSSSSPSVLDQEDAIRKQLVDAMVKSTTPDIAPVVKCVSNVQGSLFFQFLNYISKLQGYKIRKCDTFILFFLTFSIGGMGKMRRNLENVHGFSQATYKEVLDIKATVYPQLKAIEAQVQKATFNTVMQGTDISEYFPVERNEQLQLFMDRDHVEWESRKMAFYNFLYTITSSTKKGFARGMIKALFTREYISKAKWPSFGYVASNGMKQLK